MHTHIKRIYIREPTVHADNYTRMVTPRLYARARLRTYKQALDDANVRTMKHGGIPTAFRANIAVRCARDTIDPLRQFFFSFTMPSIAITGRTRTSPLISDKYR